MALPPFFIYLLKQTKNIKTVNAAPKGTRILNLFFLVL